MDTNDYKKYIMKLAHIIVLIVLVSKQRFRKQYLHNVYDVDFDHCIQHYKDSFCNWSRH